MPIRTIVVLAALTSLLSPVAATAPVADPPAGFTALFNGRDLAGWHGLPHTDPRELAKLSPEERAKKRAADEVEFRKHWRVENGELVNDGHGAYLRPTRTTATSSC